jgi:hypothetical protein
MNLEQFQDKCNNRMCLRKTFTDFDVKGKCYTEKKQSNCYNKYINQLEKDSLKKQKKIEELKNSDTEFIIDEKWLETRQLIIERDYNQCRVWKVISPKDKKHILTNFSDDYYTLSKILDVDHIIPKSVRFDLYYDLDNLILMSRYFHRLLTDYKHPITREKITDEEKKIIYEKIKNNKML